jgi:hypothetical protein
MASDPVALLFMPPWEPIRLRADKAVVVGRSPACDLPVPSPRVSRRHAWVHREGSGYAVSDLGSTNGTYVNEQRVVGDRVLKPGDRIRVGDHVITYCVMEPTAGTITVDEHASVGTLIFAGNPLAAASQAPDALQGDLTQIPTYALLQMLEIGQKTGVLDLQSPWGRARLWMRGGRPVHAECGERRGFDAAVRIARLMDGRFFFEPGGAMPEPTIQTQMAELLLEASRQADEALR